MFEHLWSPAGVEKTFFKVIDFFKRKSNPAIDSSQSSVKEVRVTKEIKRSDVLETKDLGGQDITAEPENTDERQRAQLLEAYFSRFPYIKRSAERGEKEDALYELSDYNALLEKEWVASLDNEKITQRLFADLKDVQQQYGELIQILPTESRQNMPCFPKEGWTNLERERLLKSNLFVSSETTGCFVTRAENLSVIARQIELALGVLTAQKIADESSVARDGESQRRAA